MNYHLSDIVDKKGKTWWCPPMCRHADCRVIGLLLFILKSTNGDSEKSKPPQKDSIIQDLPHSFHSFHICTLYFD